MQIVVDAASFGAGGFAQVEKHLATARFEPRLGAKNLAMTVTWSLNREPSAANQGEAKRGGFYGVRDRNASVQRSGIAGRSRPHKPAIPLGKHPAYFKQGVGLVAGVCLVARNHLQRERPVGLRLRAEVDAAAG